MKVTEEIDALETMAITPSFPGQSKFIAMAVMLPCLTIWANAMGILGGSLFGVAKPTSPSRATFGPLLTRCSSVISSTDSSRASCLASPSRVGCLEGLSTGAGAEQVGRSTTRAVVMSIFLVICGRPGFHCSVLFYEPRLGTRGMEHHLPIRWNYRHDFVRDLRVNYGEHEILHGISFDVNRGKHW